MATHVLIHNTLVNKQVILTVHPVDKKTNLRVNEDYEYYIVNVDFLQYPNLVTDSITKITRPYHYKTKEEAVEFYNYLKEELCKPLTELS